MNELHSITFQKGLQLTTDYEWKPIKRLVGDFGVVCTTISFPISEETKDVVSTDFGDEDGEEVFIPRRIRLQAFDLQVGCAVSCNVGESEGKISALIDWLCCELPTNGDGLAIWIPLYQCGYNKCYLKSLGDVDYTYMASHEVAEFELTLRVCDPITRVRLREFKIDGKKELRLSDKQEDVTD